MANLPREQTMQRMHRSAVSAPGVVLWATETTYPPTGFRVEAEVTNDVVAGEVALAHAEKPADFFYDVETVNDLHPDVAGVFQDREFGEGAFGEGPFGGVETIWADEKRPPGWKLEGT